MFHKILKGQIQSIYDVTADMVIPQTTADLVPRQYNLFLHNSSSLLPSCEFGLLQVYGIPMIIKLGYIG